MLDLRLSLNFNNPTDEYKKHIYFSHLGDKILVFKSLSVTMSSQSEKLSFSTRLKSALAQANHPISPTYLSNEFNHRYDGQAVSVQSANNWLLGKAIPNQDKLAVLAIWLNVSSQWLRFGEDLNPHASTASSDLSAQEVQFLVKLNKLTAKQKELLNLVMDEFIQ